MSDADTSLTFDGEMARNHKLHYLPSVALAAVVSSCVARPQTYFVTAAA